MRDCKACRKNTSVPCFTEGQEGCWYTQTKEQNRKPVSFDFVKNFDYDSIEYFDGRITEEERMEKERQGLEKATREKDIRKLNGQQLIREDYELVRGTGRVSKGKYYGQIKPVSESETRARLESSIAKTTVIPETKIYSPGELQNFRYNYTSTGYGYTEDECFKGFTDPEPNPNYEETLDCRLHIRATVFYDVDKLADRMPGRNNGYYKYGVKPKCPVCNITVDEYGHCPECDERVIKVHNGRGNVVTILAKNKGRYNYRKRDYCEYVVVKDNKVTTIDVKEYNTTWLQDIDMNKQNFVGHVHKKSCGRGPTGWLSHKPEEVAKHSHNVSIKVDPIIIPLPEKDQYGNIVEAISKLPVVRVKKELGTCPDGCGAVTKVKDLRRGETVCPRCGYVYKQILMVYEDKRWGDDGPELADYKEV